MQFVKLSILYFAYFSLLGVMAPYMGLYLKAQKFSLFEIAQMASLLMLTKVVAPLLWGAIADRHQNSVLLVRVGSLLSFLCFIGFFFASTFWQYSVAIIFFSFFWNAILPQIEVVTLFSLADKKDHYGKIRLWGSIGFIVSVVSLGLLFETFGIDYFPWVLLIITCSIWLISQLLFNEPDGQKISAIGIMSEAKGDNNRSGFFDQLNHKRVVLFFFVCFLLQVSHGAYYTYFSLFLESLGYSKNDIGWLWGLGVIAEVVLFLVMHRWFEQHSVKTIMLIALILSSLRWYFTAEFSTVLTCLIGLQCLHAFSFGAMHAAAIKFVHETFERKNQGRAQALYSSLGFGAGGAVGAFASGILVSYSNYEMAFKFSAVITLIAVLCVIFMVPAPKNNST